MTARDSST